MDPVAAKYASLLVPRYTSYPTIPHFSERVTEERYASWLRALDPTQPVSLYFHVPYCSRVCWYCGCNMKLAANYRPLAAYVESLIREIDLVSAYLPARLRVSHIHWGGGTPNTLSPEDLERVMGAVRRRFDLTNDAELAIECDPRTLTEAMMVRAGRLGFNRASFGVQEFDDRVQHAINRFQPYDVVRQAVEGMRRAGVEAVNFDLLYGLPHQTVENVRTTVEQCLTLSPDRIALFGYAHVPWMAKKQRMIDETALPDGAERMRQADIAAQTLVDAGYVPIGLDHFAWPDDPLAEAVRTGTLRRNFQGYTTDDAETLLGFGATSISRTPRGYVQSIRETGAWGRAIADGRLPVEKGHMFSGDDLLRAHIIERLMCMSSVDTAAAARRFGFPGNWLETEIGLLSAMARDGFVTLDGAIVRLTEAGLPFVRVVASAFDAYADTGPVRHSVAV